ncbi:hypothetical protein Zmor_008821 [Zophobas morio]|jgi:hypothetical protein|uniref:Uncharacterized protein n=1 Tax=Zophobas morio TaxID=2755281 RepID=A0AA38M022_9CUCU|nr:hypothetical protein Zmor_008821 [Zophobas morio]
MEEEEQRDSRTSNEPTLLHFSRCSQITILLTFINFVGRTFQGYKRAVLAVLTRDPSFQNSHILQSVEDVVWMRVIRTHLNIIAYLLLAALLQLNAVQPPSQRAIYTLERLQENVAREDAFWQHEAPSLLDNRSFEKWSTLDKFYVQLLCCDFARVSKRFRKLLPHPFLIPFCKGHS